MKISKGIVIDSALGCFKNFSPTTEKERPLSAAKRWHTWPEIEKKEPELPLAEAFSSAPLCLQEILAANCQIFLVLGAS
ncbi:hypothetical protein LZ554_008922 [Drepanopeziza brunnea f. sp. 'monogermtubi']|nr:hypothetical protein LZ554_008922 [Drepanopeziza brunnea f. sp. 'monogermtubi']